MALPFKSWKPRHLLRGVVAAMIVAGLSAMLTVGVLLRPGRRRKDREE